MSILSNSKNGLTIVSDDISAASHRIRLITAEKSIEAEIIILDAENPLPEDILSVTPSGKLPIVLDRSLFLFNEKVISEYIDERFPYPSLMPIDPMTRAKLRLFTYRIESEWYTRVERLELDSISQAERKKLIKELNESISSFSPIFKQSKFLISDSFTLLDCTVSPILWRLKKLGIKLPKQVAINISDYVNEIFKREGFQNSLSDKEKEFN